MAKANKYQKIGLNESAKEHKVPGILGQRTWYDTSITLESIAAEDEKDYTKFEASYGTAKRAGKGLINDLVGTLTKYTSAWDSQKKAKVDSYKLEANDGVVTAQFRMPYWGTWMYDVEGKFMIDTNKKSFNVQINSKEPIPESVKESLKQKLYSALVKRAYMFKTNKKDDKAEAKAEADAPEESGAEAPAEKPSENGYKAWMEKITPYLAEGEKSGYLQNFIKNYIDAANAAQAQKKGAAA